MPAVDRQILERSNEYLLLRQSIVQNNLANDPTRAVRSKYACDLQTRRNADVADARSQKPQ